MATKYKRFLVICQEWPKYEKRSEYMLTLKDHLENEGRKKFTHGASTQITDQQKCERTLKSLERLSTNFYRQKYPRHVETTYSGNDLKTLTNGMDEWEKKNIAKIDGKQDSV